MRIAITGASGFIGRYVLGELLKHNVEIIAITRDVTKLIDFEKSVELVEMDIACSGPDSYEKIGSPDVLVHLAWDGLPNYKSLHHFEDELPKQYQFLKSLVEAGLPSMLVTGTCFEYGMQSGELSPRIETKPSNPYGFAKDALRKQLEFLRSSKPFEMTWGRLFYMYGEGQSNTSLYPKLKEAISRGDKIFNMSGGEQLRDYLPVQDAARIIVKLALGRRGLGEINICSGEPVSVRRLVEGWISQNNWEIELNLGHYAYPDYEPMAFWGESSL